MDQCAEAFARYVSADCGEYLNIENILSPRKRPNNMQGINSRGQNRVYKLTSESSTLGDDRLSYRDNHAWNRPVDAIDRIERGQRELLLLVGMQITARGISLLGGHTD